MKLSDYYTSPITTRTIAEIAQTIKSRWRAGKTTAELATKYQGSSIIVGLPPAEVENIFNASTQREIIEAFVQQPMCGVRTAVSLQQQGILGDTERTLNYVYHSWSVVQMLRTDVAAVGLGKDFCNALRLTSYDDVTVEGLRIPFPGPFSFRLPLDTYYVYDQGRGGVGAWTALELVTLNSAVDNEGVRNIYAEFWSGLDANSTDIGDDFYVSFPIFIEGDGDENQTISELREKYPIDMDIRVAGETEPQTGRVLEDIVYGSLLYLNTYKPSLLRVSNRQHTTITELVEPPERTIRIKPKQITSRSWTTALVNLDLPDLTRTAYKHIVIGHWRNVPYGHRVYGPRPTRRLYIAPHIRHREGPGKLHAEYDIEGLET